MAPRTKHVPVNAKCAHFLLYSDTHTQCHARPFHKETRRPTKVLNSGPNATLQQNNYLANESAQIKSMKGTASMSVLIGHS